MSYPILSKERIAENTYSAEILAPHIARSRKSGQFVMICIHRECCERVPLTIVDSDPEKGSIRLIWQTVGKTTAALSDMEVGDEIDSVTGPLGRPTVIEHFGTVICVGGGVGNAALLPIAKALKEANNTVVSILVLCQPYRLGFLLAVNGHLRRQKSSTYFSRPPVSSLHLPIECGALTLNSRIDKALGAKTKDLLILESEFGQLSDELIITKEGERTLWGWGDKCHYPPIDTYYGKDIS